MWVFFFFLVNIFIWVGFEFGFVKWVLVVLLTACVSRFDFFFFEGLVSDLMWVCFVFREMKMGLYCFMD